MKFELIHAAIPHPDLGDHKLAFTLPLGLHRHHYLHGAISITIIM